MKLTTIQTGNFKLDGGAMFGVVPKVLWNRLNPADDNNLCNWAMRCLLVEINDKKILIDTGIGNKQSDTFYSHYYLNGSDSLEQSLANAGINASEITDVLLTHLHFDHCGGAVIKQNEELVPAFPNAKYYVSKVQWDHANNPNPRDKASFLKERLASNFALDQRLRL
jgi:glyoxylase-like metal-dependent hydrolase (beta-lactamase superfamily II)